MATPDTIILVVSSYSRMYEITPFHILLNLSLSFSVGGLCHLRASLSLKPRAIQLSTQKRTLRVFLGLRIRKKRQTLTTLSPQTHTPQTPNLQPKALNPQASCVPRAPAEHPSFTHVPAQKLEVSTAPRGFGGFVVVAVFRVWGLGFR